MLHYTNLTILPCVPPAFLALVAISVVKDHLQKDYQNIQKSFVLVMFTFFNCDYTIETVKNFTRILHYLPLTFCYRQIVYFIYSLLTNCKILFIVPFKIFLYYLLKPFLKSLQYFLQSSNRTDTIFIYKSKIGCLSNSF